MLAIEGGRIMKELNERMKELRTQLHLSQEYVANFLGINRATFTQMENGKRKITAEEVSKLSKLFEYQLIRFYMEREIASQQLYSHAALKT
jgi:transcriptional regulator with XRE-family HTH domain